MAYQKQIWENLPSTNTPVNADRLNHMEDGIYDASTQIVNAHSTSTDKAYSANYINDLVTNYNGVILWANQNPTADFASQNITLSSSNYDMLEWCFRDVGSSYFFTTKTLKGYGGQVSYDSAGVSARHWIRRFSYTSDTQYAINDCSKCDSDAIVSENANLVPLYVIGYNIGLFN